ncbi:hypothetical protein [Thalassovita mangrovi]|uniref:Type IV pilus biogenesis protein PilP n=1 Tax=Thalassovita mangrovi TaxID=2692236 RepID=A0A6L8LFB3_9RHOB|nr:hypothetical protein [Thalassovita mangrovi]MYM54598.1 hypothetical protein [Thalassovita mangrovi]
MKPNFALTLSFEGIDLLHRVPTGWHLVGSVRFDDADLTGALAGLREAAFGLEPDGLTTKLVLPDDQIKYIDVATDGTDADGYEALAHKALEGATPYDLSELAIDWAEKDGRLHVAAVARETLAEAESFAHEHQFNPVSFVAQPAEGTFEGEPFFGGTHAATELFGGPVTPDRDPIKVIGKAQPPEPEAAPEPEPQPEPAAKAPEPAPLIEEIGVPSFDIIDAPEKAPEAAPETPSEPEDYEEAARLAEQELGPGRDLTPEEEEMLKAFEAKESEPAAQPDLPLAPPPAPAAEPAAVKAPAPEAKQAADAPAPSFSTVRAKRDTAPDSAPPLEGAQRGLSGASAAPAPEAPAPKAFDPIPVAETRAADPEAAMLDMADSLRPTEVQAPERTSLLSRLKQAGRRGKAVPPPETEAQRLTVFGARDSKSVGGKPRFMGLILTALLLVFMVIMAAWASLGSDGVASLLGRDTPDNIAEVLPTDTVTEEELAEAGTPATASTEPPLEQAIALPAPEPDAPVEAELEPEPDLADSPDPAAAPTLQASEERYATTGIWQMAPESPALPGTSVLDDLYVASIDHPVMGVDAVALPDPRRMDGDAALAQPADPAAAGTSFDFDPRGLVKASPEGSMSPDGILIYSGKPPVTPPKWPERDESRNETSELDNTRLAAMRPKPRPDDLIEQTERSNLGGRTRVELAALRPQLRPASAQEQAAVDDTPTEQAVAASLKPKNRPENFAAIVASAEQQPEPDLPTGSIFKQPTAQPVQPSLPSKASVARQATLKNQINLHKVNLIGVYGQPSDRRALVRLSSGRYKKVQVGDRIDGGKVAAIGDGELSYVKSGRTVTLKMPKG